MSRLLSLLRGIETSLWSRLGRWAQEVSSQLDQIQVGQGYLTQLVWYVNASTGSDALIMLTKFLAVLSLSLMLTSCPPATDPTQQRPPPVGQDAAVLPDGATATPCEASCAAYRMLGCPEGADTKKGHKCEEVCTNAAQNGIDLAGAVSCVIQAGTCQEVRACSK